MTKLFLCFLLIAQTAYAGPKKVAHAVQLSASTENMLPMIQTLDVALGLALLRS